MTRPQITVCSTLRRLFGPHACGRRRFHDRVVPFRGNQWHYCSFDFGGFTGTLQGNSGNLPAFTSAGKFGNAVEFSMNEWIKTDAFADTLDIDGAKPRTISLWFMPYAAQNNEGEAGLYSMGGHHNSLAPLRTEWAIRGFWGGGSTRFRSQHYSWDVEVEIAEGMDDRWVHVASTYDGTVINHWVDGVKRRMNHSGWGTDKAVSIFTEYARNDDELRLGMGLLDQHQTNL